MQRTKFFICRKCGNLVGMVHASGAPLTCCGQLMEELVPNTTEASTEKHLPVVTVEGNLVKATVGSAAHPMTEEHLIQWIYLLTEHGGQRKALKPGDAPEAAFALTDDKPLAVLAYCNLHGLWMKEI